MKAQVIGLYARVEAAHATLPPTACGAGCDHCCHLPVEANAVEVMTLVQHLLETRDEAGLAALRAALRAHVAVVEATPAAERIALRQPCPLLVDHRCSVYEARPLACRAFHSADAEGCATALKTENARVGFRFPDKRRFAIASQASALLVDGARGVGRDTASYNLGQALAIALESPDETQARWDRGEAVFPPSARPFEDGIAAT